MMVHPKIKDINGFLSLYDMYAPALYGVILKLIPDVQAANIILEKSFVKIWEKRDCYNSTTGQYFGLMLRITLQQCGREVSVPKTKASLVT